MKNLVFNYLLEQKLWLTNLKIMYILSTNERQNIMREGGSVMIENFGNRLKAARKMAGFSMDKLAQEAGGIVTKQAISKYEMNKMKPDSQVLNALSKTLGIKTEYLFRDSKVSLAGLEFRKKSKLAKKVEDQIKHKTLDFLERYIEVEEILNQIAGYKNPLSGFEINSRNDIEQAAKKLRKKWHLGDAPISNLMELLEDKGIRIFEVDVDDEFDGLSAFAGHIPVIAVRSQNDLVRKRFTIAHELGHIILDFSAIEVTSQERLCHSFAGALLLPENIIYAELGKRRKRVTLWELKKLKGIYGISIQAIMARAHNLGIISDYSYREFCIILNKKGWKKEEPGTYEGKERPNRFKQLVYRAVAEEIISFSRGAELLNISLPEFRRRVQIVS
jgi:Zn-dependent peptidase ImmA (M78 family)/DNA-binding XRE family transcriptional regulator